MEIHGKLGAKAKRAGTKKPFIEQVTGDELQRNTGKWAEHSRVIDRDNGRYKEDVIDPKTGEVLYHRDEPLSKHTGHGDARHSGKPRKPSE